ncbi:dolichyl-P-Man:Man(7)GlcNAc(2)-PP-dolichol alpha-1,6-mannosyltransferase [Mortierella claussenii]|nr:dolichyl-P-Man:Man(7)GlcNAc(2)-PP-dolichol alpha-1,6-mannosyltransferase [Mortierella claussenii]
MATSEMDEQAKVTSHQHQHHLNGNRNGHVYSNGANGTTVNGNDLKARFKVVPSQTHSHSRVSSSSSSSSTSTGSIHSSTSSFSTYSSSYLSTTTSARTAATTSGGAWTVLEYMLHCAVLALIVLHIVVAPFTKVEESFNLQATHDILTFGVSSNAVNQFDHLEFPGVVPRTFVGPLLLALGSWPVMAIVRLLSTVSELPKGISGQIIVNLAFSYWLQASSQSSRSFTEQRLFRMIDCLVLTAVLFRSEILILLGPIVLLELAMTRLRLFPTILRGLKAGFASLALAVAVDSWFWKQWMWAEGVVFWFNAVQGKSVAWGVSPWHTYFTSLLPKISGIALPLALVAVVIEPRFRRYMVPIVVFVTAYSSLGHKEWRFVIYVVPILNLGAAITLSWLIKRKTLAYKLLTVVLFGALGLSFIASIAQSWISSFNYPGGQALQRLHELEYPHFTAAAMVHIDGAAAETGCSRFGEIASSTSPLHPESPWTYSKDESHTKRRDYLRYTHLLTSQPDLHQHDFDVLDQVNGYAGLVRVPMATVKKTCPAAVQTLLKASIGGSGLLSRNGLETLWRECSPLQIKTEGRIWIMRRFRA